MADEQEGSSPGPEDGGGEESAPVAGEGAGAPEAAAAARADDAGAAAAARADDAGASAAARADDAGASAAARADDAGASAAADRVDAPVAAGPFPARRFLLFGGAVIAGTAIDLWSKAAVFASLGEHIGESRVLIPGWFDLTLAQNIGAAFGMLPGQHDIFFLISVVAFAVVTYFVHVADRRAIALPLVFGVLLAGVVGNFWDRAVHGSVRDFLNVHAPDGSGLAAFLDRVAGAHIWPTFNAADIFIVVGAGALVVLFTLEERRERRERERAAAAATD